MIQATLSSYDNILSVSELCRIANVSRSGYYRWAAAAESRARRKAQDQNDFALILRAYNHRGYAKGARSIYMRLLHLNPAPAFGNSCVHESQENPKNYE